MVMPVTLIIYMEMKMSEDKYTKFMKSLLILLAPFAIGIWLFLGLMQLIY
jgi:hypothetical protein